LNATPDDDRACQPLQRQPRWSPYLPEPQPAFVFDEDDPEPVELDVLRRLRDLCAGFRLPPREFCGLVPEDKLTGAYEVETDTVYVDRARASWDGMGGDDGYYVVLLHELLHATGHPSRLARATTGDYSAEGYDLEEGTVLMARIVLEAIGFHDEALDWHAPAGHGLPVDPTAARDAAGWILGEALDRPRAGMCRRRGRAEVPPRPTSQRSRHLHFV
jgi:hypothetical protein